LQLSRFLSGNPSLNVEVQGHTDNIGGENYNFALSERRAKSVMEFLIGEGIAKDRLTARGYGMGKPISDNLTEEGRSKNRRTTIEIISVSLPDRP
jgi:outer membrane protein OmpA-like peptidoglycan-associated protein